MKKVFLILLTSALVIPCLSLLAGCGGDPNTYLKATIGAHEHMTIDAPGGVTEGKFTFIKGQNMTFYITVDHGYDPKTVEVRINDTLLTIFEIVGRNVSYTISAPGTDVTLQITNPQLKTAGIYDFLEIRKESDDSVFEGDYNDMIDIGWDYGSGVQLTLAADGTLKYNAGNPDPISIGEYEFEDDTLSFTPIGQPNGSSVRKEIPFVPGYVYHSFANNEYYVVFELNYAYL